MSRTIKRSIARGQYARFARNWREDLRRAGLYGQARSPKRPTFNQWYAMQYPSAPLESVETRAELLATDVDPWAESQETAGASEPERGVVTMDIAGRDED